MRLLRGRYALMICPYDAALYRVFSLLTSKRLTDKPRLLALWTSMANSANGGRAIVVLVRLRASSYQHEDHKISLNVACATPRAYERQDTKCRIALSYVPCYIFRRNS